MQIYEALKKDHEEVKGLLEQLVHTKEDGDEASRNKLIAKIRDALVPHSRAEESVFYNSLREIGTTKVLVAHAYGEHIQAETMLRTLQVQGRIDAGWLETAKTLKAALEHHISEEEGEIFSAAKQVFTEDEAKMMGAAFEGLKPQIKKEGLMATSIELVANLMPPRFAKAFRSFNLDSRVK